MRHSIQTKLSFVFLTFLILVAGSVVATSRGLESQINDTFTIGAAVEQRELVHAVSGHVFRVQAGRQREEYDLALIELDKSSKQIDNILETMLSGGVLPFNNLEESIEISAVSDTSIRTQIQLIRKRWMPISTAIKILLTDTTSVLIRSRAITDIQTQTTYLSRELDTLVEMLANDSSRNLTLLKSIQITFFLGALALLGWGYWFVRYFIIRPLDYLDLSAKQITAGNLQESIATQHEDEIGDLTLSFETMRSELATAREASELWTEQLERRVDQRTKALRALVEISADITSELDLNHVLSSIVHNCRQLIGADLAVLCMIKVRTQTINVASVSGEKDAIISKHKPLNMGNVENVIEKGQTISCSGREVCSMIATAYTGAHIAAPVRVGDQVLGALCVSHRQKDSFSSEAPNLLTLLANSAAIALSNAQLFNKAKTVATILERERIAAEMHDGLAQTLGYINLQVDQALATSDNGQSNQVREYLLRIQPAIQNAYDATRRMLIGATESHLSEQKFEMQLKEILEEFQQKTGLMTELHMESASFLAFPNQSQHQLLHIIKESLINVQKHASASLVEVTVEASPKTTVVTIIDDGCGFDLTAKSTNKSGHLGLKIMRGRAERIGGKLAVTSKPGEGTNVTVKVPLEQVLSQWTLKQVSSQ